MTLPAFWRGVLLSFIGAVVVPFLTAAQQMITAQTVNWIQLGWLAAGLFIAFLIAFLTGLVHDPVTGQFIPASRRAPPTHG